MSSNPPHHRLLCRTCGRVRHMDRVLTQDEVRRLRCSHCKAREPEVSVVEPVDPYEPGYVPVDVTKGWRK